MNTFDITSDTMVVTSTYVTEAKLPILYVTHEHDEKEGTIWQFHCGNGDYNPEKLQLVRLDTILRIDPAIGDLAGLAMGFSAKRESKDSPWKIVRE